MLKNKLAQRLIIQISRFADHRCEKREESAMVRPVFFFFIIINSFPSHCDSCSGIRLTNAQKETFLIQKCVLPASY